MLTQPELKKQLHYGPETGLFTRLASNSSTVNIGDIAGCKGSDGYVVIRVNGKDYKSHRLAWLYMTGEWPMHEIDHINGVKHDNQLSNLREATRSENLMNRGYQKNNTSGYKGVSLNKKRNKWQAQIVINKKAKYLGLFDSPKDAHTAYCQAALDMHGEFSNTG